MAADKKKNKNLLKFCAITLLSLLVYKDLLVWLFFKTRFPYEGWDFIIPVLSIIFSYLNFQKLQAAKIKWKRNNMGLLLLAGALGLYLISQALFFYYLQTFSFILFLSGTLFYFGGYTVWSFFMFPIFLLLFKLPLGLLLIKTFGTEGVSMFQAQLVAYLSSLVGIASTASKSFVYGARFNSEILPQCTGWYTIDAKILIGTLFLYVSKDRIKTKIIKWVLLFPAVAIINFFRILLLHISWNLFVGVFSADSIHSITNHIHKIILFIFFYFLAFYDNQKKK